MEDVHEEHVKLVKDQYNDRIQSLENKLAQSNESLKEKETILHKMENEKEGNSQLNQSLVDLLNNSRNGNIENDNFHDEVITELEKQLNQMRKD